MRRSSRLLVVPLLLLALACTGAFAKRLALVVGNDGYQSFTRLEKAGADAEAMAKELEAAGFEVSLRRDLSYRKMVVAFEEFYDKVRSGDELFIFYAGHGVQTDRGAFLLPVDIEGDTASQIEKMSYPVNVLFEELDRMKARVAIVVVDACRDNPLRVRGKAIGAARGLSGPDVAKGQMAIFSAGRNQKAIDTLSANDKHPNGVFTRELLARMRTPGLSIEALANDVRNAVERLAASVRHEQRPLVVNDTVGDFFLYPSTRTAQPGAPAAVGTATAAADPTAREDRFWEDAKGADNVEGYEAYLATYPNGRYRGLARAHITRLNKPASLAQNTRGATDAAPAASTAPAAPGPATAPPAADVAPPAAGGPSPQVPTEVPTRAPTQGPAAQAPSGTTPSGTAPSTPNAGPSSPSPPRTLPTPLPATTASPPPPAGAEPATRTRATYALPNGDRYDGEVLANKRSGKGIYTFSNGDRYEGSFDNDQFMGQGTMAFANGDRYEGEFVGIVRQGRGTMVFANKDRYEGQFADNLYHGEGVFTFASGERYQGSFQRGLKVGTGEQVFANKDRYTGPFVADKPHGRGRTTHANGDLYEGEFVAGIKQGDGTYTFTNGDRYEGAFADGLFSGRGRLYHANGDRYEGSFKANVKEGQGVHYFANKDRYEGPFAAGAPHGTGTLYFANGDRFVGNFTRGVRHGKGVHHFASGQTREIEYVEGVEKP